MQSEPLRSRKRETATKLTWWVRDIVSIDYKNIFSLLIKHLSSPTSLHSNTRFEVKVA